MISVWKSILEIGEKDCFTKMPLNISERYFKINFFGNLHKKISLRNPL